MTIDVNLVWLGIVTLGAATVNGALGYGFSSITVPLALLFIASRTLNPALILVEVAVNGYSLWVNRNSAQVALRRTWPILLGLMPGIALGSLFLASLNPDIVKLVTYAVLLPIILTQTAGLRRPISSDRAIGVPVGVGVGLLYSVTTISGPPLAILFNNQGYDRRDFRASLGVVRLTESSLTAVSYLTLGLITPTSTALIPVIVPSVVAGIPLGAWLIRRFDPETFRRLCMSFDAWIVGFGLSRVLEDLAVVESPPSYGVLLFVVFIDLVLLYRFFVVRRRARHGGDEGGDGLPRMTWVRTEARTEGGQAHSQREH